MAEIKATRTKDGILLSGNLPPELLSASSVEVIQLRDGSFLVTPKAAQPKTGGLLSDKEKAVVRKLLSVRFDSRTPQQIGGLLSKDEKDTLESLMKRKIVHLFKEGKYSREGVYSVSDFAFHQSREDDSREKQPIAQPSAAQVPVSSSEHLEKFGWMVLETDAEARNFSNAFPEKIRSGAVKGIRAFDRKFYFVTPQFLMLWEKKINSALGKGEKTAEEMADEIGLTAEGARCLLLHLCESGELLEKHRGKFARA